MAHKFNQSCSNISLPASLPKPAASSAQRQCSPTVHRELKPVMSGHVSTSLDSRQVLQAFRVIGSSDGIRCSELYEMVRNVRNDHIRVPLQKDLNEFFRKHDHDRNGVLDIVEFEDMLKSSTMLESAIYEMLELEDSKMEQAANSRLSVSMSRESHMPFAEHGFQAVSMMLVVFDIICRVIAVDTSPHWSGWRGLELGFACFFTLDITIRFFLDSRHGRQVACNLVDLVVTIGTWIDVVLAYTQSEGSSIYIDSSCWAHALQFLRFARLIRLGCLFPSLISLLMQLFKSIRRVLWGLVVTFSVVFFWAFVIRHMVVHRCISDDEGIIEDIFASLPRASFLLLRCLVLSADGACLDPKYKENIFSLLTLQFGSWIFDLAWVASEFLVRIGILNTIIAIFVTQAIDHQSELRDEQLDSGNAETQSRCGRLDKLLRTLIHPTRKGSSNPKDRNATEVATMIRLDYPEVAAHFPDLEPQLAKFSDSILDAKIIHQKAMDEHQFREGDEFKRLQNTPSASFYLVDGDEKLLSDDASISENPLGLEVAPIGAVPVLLMQEHNDLEDLFFEAEEVQAHVKNCILPNSAWASEEAAGKSGTIWKQSGMLCDEAIDPGIKSWERAEQKVTMKYGGRYARNRDYCRLCLVYDTIDHLMKALPILLSFQLADPGDNSLQASTSSSRGSGGANKSSGQNYRPHLSHSQSTNTFLISSKARERSFMNAREGFQVVCIENRFVHPHPLGWRDMTALLKVCMPSSGRYHIMELQMVLRSLQDVKGSAHKIYDSIRAHLPNALVMQIVDQLVTDTTLDLGITKSEWDQCIKNKEVIDLLDEFGIPKHSRASLFDIVDIDGSGKVTSSELRETLQLYNKSVQASEIVSCHLRVKEMQQQLHFRLEPRLIKMHNLAAASHQCILQGVLPGEPAHHTLDEPSGQSERCTARTQDRDSATGGVTVGQGLSDWRNNHAHATLKKGYNVRMSMGMSNFGDPFASLGRPSTTQRASIASRTSTYSRASIASRISTYSAPSSSDSKGSDEKDSPKRTEDSEQKDSDDDANSLPDMNEAWI